MKIREQTIKFTADKTHAIKPKQKQQKKIKENYKSY